MHLVIAIHCLFILANTYTTAATEDLRIHPNYAEMWYNPP
jgi:hypothetical protein